MARLEAPAGPEAAGGWEEATAGGVAEGKAEGRAELAARGLEVGWAGAQAGWEGAGLAAPRQRSMRRRRAPAAAAPQCAGAYF